MKKRKISFTTVGGSSILTIFAVLCFIVFALLSLSTAKANRILTDKSITAVSEYYEADAQAEQILAKIRLGDCPQDVLREKDTYSYACDAGENQKLYVTVRVDADGNYDILQWQRKYVGEWKADDSIKVWGGAEITE